MKTTNFITCSRRVFLVKFIRSTEHFIVQDEQLFALLKAKDQNLIEFIKASESPIPNFKRCSKALILRQFNWNTEIYLFLKSLPFFRGVKE